jgi:hypothetical protein
MLDKLLFLIALAGTAVVFADVLVRPGMLLESVQRKVREWYSATLRKYCEQSFERAKLTEAQRQYYYQTRSMEVDQEWWWAPLWGCYKCVAGQWGFWGYLLRYYPGYSWRTVPEHLAFTAFTIITAILLHKWTQEN